MLLWLKLKLAEFNKSYLNNIINIFTVIHIINIFTLVTPSNLRY